MYTKKELCEFYLRSFAKEKLNMKVPIKLEEIPESFITTSSIVAICMEYLELIKNPELINYAKGRGGTLLISSYEDGCPCIVSFRELIESLPEEI